MIVYPLLVAFMVAREAEARQGACQRGRCVHPQFGIKCSSEDEGGRSLSIHLPREDYNSTASSSSFKYLIILLVVE